MPLQTIQNKAITAISDSGWRVHVTPLYYEHKIFKVNDIYKIESANFMHKYVNKNLPDYFQNYFNKVSGNHGYSTRAATNDDLTIPFFRTNRCQKSFKYQGSKLWNSLTKNMTKLGYNKFIEQYKTSLISFCKIRTRGSRLTRRLHVPSRLPFIASFYVYLQYPLI